MSQLAFTFEAVIARLEEILKILNIGTMPLQETLKLYEEADLLLKAAQSELAAAEQKIETLIHNRNGQVEVADFK